MYLIVRAHIPQNQVHLDVRFAARDFCSVSEFLLFVRLRASLVLTISTPPEMGWRGNAKWAMVGQGVNSRAPTRRVFGLKILEVQIYVHSEMDKLVDEVMMMLCCDLLMVELGVELVMERSRNFVLQSYDNILDASSLDAHPRIDIQQLNVHPPCDK